MSNSVFTFTDYFEPDSTAVDRIHYNRDNSELAVTLGNNVYVYSDVPTSVYNDFLNAPSAGRFYGNYVKGNFVSEFLDFLPYTTFTEKRQLVGAGALSSAYESARVGNEWSGPAVSGSLDGAKPEPVKAPADVPQPAYHALKVVEPVLTQKFDVNFEVNGKDATHTLRALDVDDAVGQVDDIAAMLDLEFDVKSVTVYFE